MIYVTHDQTEALTFADKVVVMYEGEVVQIGTPEELFERPAHTFVGYFIGSPGMNVLPAAVDGRTAHIGDSAITLGSQLPDIRRARQRVELGIRPEFLRVAERRSGPAGRRYAASRTSGSCKIVRARARRAANRCDRRARTKPCLRAAPALVLDPSARARLRRRPAASRAASADGQDPSTTGPGSWSCRCWCCVAFSRHHAADDGGQLLGAGHLRQQPVLLDGIDWFKELLDPTTTSAAVLRCVGRNLVFSADRPGDRDPARHRRRAAACRASGWRRRRLPGADGAAAADPVERGRHDLADLRAAPTSACSAATLNTLGIDYNYTAGPSTPGSRSSSWMSGTGPAGRAALLCRACASIPDAYLPGGHDRRRLALGGVPLHPAAEDARVLMIAVLLRFMDSFMIYTEPFVLTGGGPGNATTFLSIDLVKIALGQFDLGPAAAMSLIYFLIILLLCWVFYTVMTNDASERAERRRPRHA